MSRKITFVLLISLFFTVPVFAQYDLCETDLKIPLFNHASYFAAAVPGEEEDEGEAAAEAEEPGNIRNNEFFLESVRLTKLAQDTFEYGDYDASAGFAEEAIRFAQLSNEHIAVQLIAEAKRLISWADSNNIANRHPDEYNESKNYYEASLEAQLNEEWDDAITAATKSIEILAAFEAGGSSQLARQFTVRPWASSGDCFWNIAGYPGVYGEPGRWRVLYEANKSKIPDPNNPDVIEPGTVLDIPSIRGETRQGMWDSSRTYVRP